MNIVFADVGARGALPQHWVNARLPVTVIGFEPDVDEWRRLVAMQPEAAFFNVALSRQAGTLPLYCTRIPGLTSVFPPNRALLDQFPNADAYDVLDERLVDAVTLDRVVAASDLPGVDMLKVDTQGSELHVLQGAAQTLTSVLCVEVEVEYVPMYVSQPLFGEIDRFMRGFGFVLARIDTHTWIRTQDQCPCVVWADAVYLKHGATSEKARAIASVYGCSHYE